MAENYLRRTVLGAIGALGLAGTTAAHHEKGHDPCEGRPRGCDDCPDPKACKKGEPSTQGEFHVKNHSKCTRHISVFTSEDTYSIHVGPGESESIYIYGRMKRLDAEDGDLEFYIAQRTEHVADNCNDPGPRYHD